MNDKALIDRESLNAIAVARGEGKSTMAAAAVMGQVMAASGMMVPAHCRGKPDLCCSITIIAWRFGMDPYAVASKSYVVGDKLAFEAQLWHACLTQSGIMSRRLRERYMGEGGARQCEITGWIKGEEEPFVLTSPRFADITPKNSPLWKSNPDLQLYYWTVRNWSRKYCPEVMLGLYTADELEPIGTPTRITQTPRSTADLMAARPAPAFVEPVAEVVEPEPPKEPVDHSQDIQAYEVAVTECETLELLWLLESYWRPRIKDWPADQRSWAWEFYKTRKAQLAGGAT